MSIIQIGNTGFNAEAFKKWTEERFMKQYGSIPGAANAWREIQKHNGGGSKPASGASSGSDKSETKGGSKNRKKN